MDIKIYNQADFALKNYHSDAVFCHKIGMILDAEYTGEYSGERNKGYNKVVPFMKGTYKQHVVWNTSTICTAGLTKGSLPEGFTNLQALFAPPQHNYKESRYYYTKLSRDDVVRYYDIMLNHTPYKEVYANHDPEYAYEHGIIIDCKHSRNLVIAALMAQRVAWENSLVAQRILHYVDLGVDKTIAFMLGFSFQVDGEQNICNWHVPLDGGRLSIYSISNFMYDNYIEEETLCESMGYTFTVHSAWGGSMYKLSNITERIAALARTGGRREFLNPFAKTLRLEPITFDDEDVAKFFKSEAVLKEMEVYYESIHC